ncbi:unnamed protein product [Rotaria sordida]|uniref:Uncharacterized protein n=1 Tax=Rotaria sordida TaxID=392033 RepID=A0A814GJ25_9BILA|nr:unnamed protein product [Rotaria sordida]
MKYVLISTIFVWLRILDQNSVSCIKCYTCNSHSNGVDFCTTQFRNSTVEDTLSKVCYESAIFNTYDGKIHGIERGIMDRVKCNNGDRKERCKSELLIDGVKRTTCCCQNQDLCNDLIIQASTCYTCNYQMDPPPLCYKPSKESTKYQISQPTERCYITKIGNDAKYPIQRGAMSGVHCDKIDGCTITNSTAGIIITRCCCNGYFCNSNIF